MSLRIALYLILLLGSAVACMPPEERLQTEAVGLEFSADTVSFDTLFTTERSITKRLRVYNPSNKAVLLQSIALKEGAASPYTLFVNGRPGKSFGAQTLLGGDSLLLLLEVQLPETSASSPYLASDAIVVVNKGLSQEVPVVGWGQNINKLGKSVIECNAVWTRGKPYLVVDTLLVKAGCTLTIEKGARVYFKPIAALVIQGTINAQGDSSAADRIVFRNHRLEPLYDQPGQWKGILFVEGTQNNYLRYCDIRNADIGIRLGAPDNNAVADLVLENCRIENHLQAGILCYTSDLEATNTLVANCVGPALANLAGGNYRYTHCTIANFFRGQRNQPAALFSNNLPLNDDSQLLAPLNLVIENSIIWGNISSGDEVALSISENTPAVVTVEHSLLRTANNQFAGAGTVLNTGIGFVQFQGVGIRNFRPEALSPAVNAGKQLNITRDLSGKARDNKPDIGALEYIGE